MGVFNGRSGVYTKGGMTAPAPFAPDDIPDLALWLDAADVSTITQSSGAVSQWNDKSGNGNHATQATAGNRPTTGANTLNGNNVLTFNSKWLDIPAGPLTIPAAKATIFIVAKLSSLVGSQAIVIWDNGTLRYGIDVYQAFRAWHGNAPGVSSETTYDTNATILMGGSVTGSAGTQFVVRRGTGQTGSPATPAPFTATSAKIGARGSGTEFFAGDIAEILAYRRFLEKTEANDLGDFLQDKWGGTWTPIP